MTSTETLVTREQALEAALKALGALLCATDHYGFTTKQSETFWENAADTAMENGHASDDVRRVAWEAARQAYNDAVQLEPFC
jgi:tRNA G46 methylase TrmB